MNESVQRASGRSTHARLLDAAEVEFAQAGFDGARLADIAERAGIRRPSLLYHFASKEALYTAVVERTFEDVGRALSAAMAGARDFEERATAPARQFAAYLERHPDVGRILLREVLDGRGPGREMIARQGMPILTFVEEFLRREGGDRITADFPLRAAIMQSVSNLLMWSVAGSELEPLWGDHHNATELARIALSATPDSQKE